MKRPTWLQKYCILAFGAMVALLPAASRASDFRSALSQVPVPDSLELSEAPEVVVWSENFDAYVTGSEVIGQGGWEGWGGSSTVGALTSSVQARSAANSIDIVGDTDLVHQYSGTPPGTWVYTAWQYLPTGVTGKTYFILLNTFPASLFGHWSTQLCFDGTANVVRDDTSGMCDVGVTTPLVRDQWVEIRVVINLATDTQRVYYNGTLFYTAPWSTHLGPDGTPAIRAVDLFANNATSTFYDDLQLEDPELFVDGFESEDTSAWSFTEP
jgi:hypothetical protein